VRAVTLLDWPVAVPTLTDGCVMLRGWIDQDADAVYAACQDAEIQRWMDVPVPYLLEHAIRFVGEQSAGEWLSQKGAPFAITCAADGGVLGSCGLVNVDARHVVAEVVCAVASHSEPLASRASGRFAGQEGLLRDKVVIGGSRRDMAVYALLKPDAPARPNRSA
jgi:RimJ/RimL family protein N-acetyltransferase